jgi:hypothetical protein
MKIITIQQTKPGVGFCANVNGFEGVFSFGKDEISALEHLLGKLKSRNEKFIQISDWGRSKDDTLSA